tara:strand:+ start:4463 stop:4738 length:276 start_codon:yes stop_codon:yes gene_type:complete
MTIKRNTIKRNYKKEYQGQLRRGDNKKQIERQRARRLLDRIGADKNKNGKADKREGKDIDHKKPIRRGGKSNLANLRLRNRKANRRDNKRT